MSQLLEALLDPARRAECARHDGLPETEVQRIAAGQPHTWEGLVPWRTDRVPRMDRRTGPRGSRWGDLA